MKCKYSKKCKEYREDSNTCNYNVDKNYCGKYREQEEKNDTKL